LPSSAEGFRRLLRWFRQRKLLQVLAVYVGASWLILEATDVFIDKLGLPAWFFPAAIIMLLIGLTVVVATAIVESAVPARVPERSPEEHERRVPTDRAHGPLWSRAAFGFAAAVAVLVVGAVILVTLRGKDDVGPIVETPANSVAVLPFRTSGADLELWREGLMDVLSANFDDVGGLHSIDTRTVLSRWRSRIGDAEATADEAVAVATDLGARWAIYGQVVELAGQLRIDGRLYELDTGDPVSSSSVAGSPDSILALIEALTVDLLRGLGEEEGWLTATRALATSSLDAVVAYLEGEQAMRRVQFDEAIEAYQRAVAADSTFALAASHLALAYGWRYHIGHESAIVAHERAVRFGNRLPPRERALVEVNYLLDQQRKESIERAEELTRRYPDDPEAWTLLGEAYYHRGFEAGFLAGETLAPFERALALDSSFTPALIHPLEVAGALNDIDRFERYARWYLSHDSTTVHAGALTLARDLALGSPDDSAAALESLPELEFEVLEWAVIFLHGNPRWAPLALRVAHEMAAPRHAADDRAWALTWRVHVIEIWRGRRAAALLALQQAEELSSRFWLPDLLQVHSFLVGLGDSAMAVRSVERLLTLYPSIHRWPQMRHIVGHYYLQVGDLEGLGREIELLAMIADSLGAAGDSLNAQVAEAAATGLEGLLAASRGNHPEAVAALREAEAMLDGPTIMGPIAHSRFARALSHAAIGEETEALHALETFDELPYMDAQAAFARAQIYERRGERQQAIRAYARVVELWKDCDPELRPTWEAAQRALRRLTAEI
jgi:serine/threonine-protein kinase